MDILFEQLEKLVEGRLNHCYFKTGIVETNLPSTPFRGQKKIYEVEIPKLNIKLDNVIWKAATFLKGISFNLQYNIDSFDSAGYSPPLSFHFDRGARYTILGALRGAVNKFTFLLPINSILETINERDLVFGLEQPIYYCRNKPEKAFSLITSDKYGYRLNSIIIKKKLEFSDIDTKNENGKIALSVFLNVINNYNKYLSHPIDFEKENLSNFYSISSVLLNEGDILVLNNSTVLHGRNAGKVIDVSQNRWLRTMFIE